MQFGTLARSLHWLVAVGLFTLLYLGLEQSGMERGPEKTEIRFFHASIAIAVSQSIDVLRRMTVSLK